MRNRIYIWTRTLHTLLKISPTKKMNDEKCYFRYIPTEEKINICFLYGVKDSMRQFNLSRNCTEQLDTLCTRIATNVQKVVSKKSKKRNVNEEAKVIVEIFKENNTKCLPPEITCSELFNCQEPLKMKILDNLYDIVFNAPWVLNFNLPKSILAGFPVYPESFETMYCEKHLSTFNWYKGIATNEKENSINDMHIKWQFLRNSFYYTPNAEDIGFKLKLHCIPANQTLVGPAIEVISKSIVEAGPGYCPFETRHMFTDSNLKDKSFRCVSYNILADLYCDSDFTRTVLHPYCPPYALHIDYRKQLILKELLGYHADLICLQEVDHKIFQNCLYPLMENNNLDGKFYKKGKTVAEGLACFYNNQRFK